MIDRGGRIIAAVVSAIVASGLMWSLVATVELSVREATLFGPFVCFLMWALLISVLKEPKREPELAPLLGRCVLNPLDNRLREMWLEEGRAQGRAEIQARLKQRGLDLDDFLLIDECDGTG